MSFAAGSDEEEYRAFIVQNWPLFAKPSKEHEQWIQKHYGRRLESFFNTAEEQDATELQCDLYRYLAIASRFKSKRCFEVIVGKMVKKIPVNRWNKPLIVSILLFYSYAEGMKILYSHEGIKSKRIFHIEDVFENEGFLHTEAADGVSAGVNTVLGIIAYGRLQEDLLKMAEVALELGAEITTNGEYVRSPLLNAIQSDNYVFLSLIAERNPVAFRSPADSDVGNAESFARRLGKNALTAWIANICANGTVGKLSHRTPSRPSSSIEFPRERSEYMPLGDLLKGGFLMPGHVVEGEISSYYNLFNHFMIYVGNYTEDNVVHNDTIVHKNGNSGSSRPRSSNSNSEQNSDGHNGWMAIDHMIKYQNEGIYKSWRRGLNTSFSWIQLRRSPIDTIFDAINDIGSCRFDIWRANCEHQANSIARGISRSIQANRMRKLVGSSGDTLRSISS